MEKQKDILGLLDMMDQPAFCVKENRIRKVNAAAQQLFLSVGQEILPMLMTGAEAYAEFAEGCLCLTLSLAGQPFNASVRRMDGLDVFLLDKDGERDALRILALAASELRKPLTAAISNASNLLAEQDDPDATRQLAQLNQGLYRMLRILGNMSDAEHGASGGRMETIEAGSFLEEIFEKAQTLVAHSGVTLQYQGLRESVYCLLNKVQLERAVLNILSNALKFTPAGGQVTASLTRRGRTLQLLVQDSGSGIAEEVMGNLFRRYLRQPGIEDSRFGLGLGLKLIQDTARNHGGIVLFRPAGETGTRIALTLAIRQSDPNTLRSPVFEVDYTGGYDHSLVELADCLPSSLYDGTF